MTFPQFEFERNVFVCDALRSKKNQKLFNDLFFFCGVSVWSLGVSHSGAVTAPDSISLWFGMQLLHNAICEHFKDSCEMIYIATNQFFLSLHLLNSGQVNEFLYTNV